MVNCQSGMRSLIVAMLWVSRMTKVPVTSRRSRAPMAATPAISNGSALRTGRPRPTTAPSRNVGEDRAIRRSRHRSRHEQEQRDRQKPAHAIGHPRNAGEEKDEGERRSRTGRGNHVPAHAGHGARSDPLWHEDPRQDNCDAQHQRTPEDVFGHGADAEAANENHRKAQHHHQLKNEEAAEDGARRDRDADAERDQQQRSQDLGPVGPR